MIDASTSKMSWSTDYPAISFIKKMRDGKSFEFNMPFSLAPTHTNARFHYLINENPQNSFEEWPRRKCFQLRRAVIQIDDDNSLFVCFCFSNFCHILQPVFRAYNSTIVRFAPMRYAQVHSTLLFLLI